MTSGKRRSWNTISSPSELQSSGSIGVPSAQNAELKVLLETGLTLFTEHQTHAEMLGQKVK